MSKLSHLDDQGRPRMVDVSEKSETARVASAEGFVDLKPGHWDALGRLPKGDALTIAKIAGIQGGKRCSELIPLCHPVSLTDLDVQIERDGERLRILTTAKTNDRTGVEMEAYTAVVVAAITLIDMLKGVDPDLEISGVRLLTKTGGKSDWKRS